MLSRALQPLWQIAALGLLLQFAPAAAVEAPFEKPAPAPEVKIVRLDPRFDTLVPKDAVVEKVLDGFTWVEGPVWNRPGNYLLFSEVPSNAIYKWEEGKGVSLYLKPSGYTGKEPFPGPEPGSNGLAFDAQGRLVRCKHGDRQIVRRDADGRETVLVERYEGKRINSPNDLVFKSNGDLYFTDPPFGLPKTFDDPGKETPFQGVYRLSKDGKLALLTKEVRAPNGIGFSPDEKTLYISNAERAHVVWLAFEVKKDGTLGKSRVLFDGTAWAKVYKGVADGLKVDKHGNLFAGGPGGLYVFAPDGTHLGTFHTGVATSNCAWGGADGSTLYITAGSTLYRVQLTAGR